MSNYKIVEIFSSINGEGPKSGQLALFIRLQGCNLRCSYCDTMWANEEDARFHWTTTEEILDVVRIMNIKNVTITGGEPLMQEHIKELLELLAKEPGIEVEIETNGSVNLRPFLEIEDGPAFTMDYKLPGSGMESQMCLENMTMLREKDTIKFVCKDHGDLIRAKEVIDAYSLVGKCHVYLSPVYGEIDLEDMVNFMKSNQMNGVNMQLQMHKIIWDSELRGV